MGEMHFVEHPDEIPTPVPARSVGTTRPARRRRSPAGPSFETTCLWCGRCLVSPGPAYRLHPACRALQAGVDNAPALKVLW